MKFFFRIILINILLSLVKATLSVSKIVVRVPKENDIGLIFDVSITNSKQSNQRERLMFKIRCAGGCDWNLGNGRVMKDVGRVVGGSFGCIAPGATETVSLILPTTSLYNRVGSCPIMITATNSKEEQFHIKETICFDTTFESLDKQGTGIRRSKMFRDCKNFDLDYLNNCKPLNCEERYFGVRNFFSPCSRQCDLVPKCQGQMLYDPFTNECVQEHYAVSKKDIQDIKRGLFKNYDEWTTDIISNSRYNRGSNFKYSKRSSSDNTTQDSSDSISAEGYETQRSSWITGMVDGLLLMFAILLLQVCATIGIYVIICFVIFLLVSFVSRNQKLRNSFSFSAAPSVSERGIPIRTRSSLFSRR